MAVINAFATLTTLTIKKGASSASVTLKRTRDGTMFFADSAGNRVVASSSDDFAKRLFDAINALV